MGWTLPFSSKILFLVLIFLLIWNFYLNQTIRVNTYKPPPNQSQGSINCSISNYRHGTVINAIHPWSNRRFKMVVQSNSVLQKKKKQINPWAKSGFIALVRIWSTPIHTNEIICNLTSLNQSKHTLVRESGQEKKSQTNNWISLVFFPSHQFLIFHHVENIDFSPGKFYFATWLKLRVARLQFNISWFSFLIVYSPSRIRPENCRLFTFISSLNIVGFNVWLIFRWCAVVLGKR